MRSTAIDRLDTTSLRMANYTLHNNQVVSTIRSSSSINNNITAGPTIFLNYPYTFNQLFCVNYLGRNVIQAQTPISYYYVPSAFIQSQYILINAASNQQSLNGIMQTVNQDASNEIINLSTSN